MAKDEKTAALAAETELQRVLKRTQGGGAPETVSLERLEAPDTEREQALLRKLREAQEQQLRQRIDYGTEQAAQELRQAEEDAQSGYQAERARISAEEQLALDNQALYAEARGDRGGIGQAQAASIRNTAALNRAALNREQRRLASETARQIASLRVKGEFEKADGLLKLGQQHLSELLELERWAQETKLSTAQFNTQLARWEAEYAWQARKFGVETELTASRLTGAFSDGTPTFEARQAERTRLASAAKALLEAGLALTPEQLDALGWTEGQYGDYLRRMQALEAEEEESASGGVGRTKKLTAKEKKAVIKTAENAAAQLAGAIGAAFGGSGVPFQQAAAWVDALQNAKDPVKTFAEIMASPSYAQASAEQKRRIAEVVKEKTKS